MKTLLYPILFLSFSLHAETPIYLDATYEVSVEEKASRPQAKGKGQCGAGQEISLKVHSLPSKREVFSELIASCLKNIDLEDSVDESVEPIGKTIYVFQTAALGILDLTGEKPTYKTSGLPKEEARNFVMKLENCNHWAGEEPTDEKRIKEISNNLKKLGCDKMTDNFELIKKKFTDDPVSLSYLEAAHKEFQ